MRGRGKENIHSLTLQSLRNVRRVEPTEFDGREPPDLLLSGSHPSHWVAKMKMTEVIRQDGYYYVQRLPPQRGEVFFAVLAIKKVGVLGVPIWRSYLNALKWNESERETQSQVLRDFHLPLQSQLTMRDVFLSGDREDEESDTQAWYRARAIGPFVN